ncbi:MAG: bifunctional folylpolyglutamate synthase/dihydrofolate synthase [Candidatus Omnitrophica bacterium]|nr:bifunctional folylpolyglutamate synthase/dihydrofolate synthase [Candidatus Omnitrophota bacterium]
MQYPGAIRYLTSFLNFERLPFEYQRQFNLKRMASLVSWFDHPEYLFSSVLVAGTKGKGSTANFISSIISAHGYSAGLYTSPHLSDPRERIRINGRVISKREFAKWMSRIRNVVERHEKEIVSYGPITYFEMITLLAILYFAAKRVDLAIFEVGMGGRLDATNVLEPLVSVITPISYDHEEHLGRTLALIAREKAAIIKKGAHVVSAAQPREAKRVIQSQIKREKAKAYFLGALFHTLREKMSKGGSSFDFQIGFGKWENLKIKLPGRFQIQNAAVALAAAGVLGNQYGFTFTEAKIREGLARAYWPGRFELARRGTRMYVLDGAHNGASMNEVCLALRTLFPGRKCVAILGTSREKNLKAILKPLLPMASTFIVTKSNNPRAQEPKVILETLSEMGYKKPTFWAESLKEALHIGTRLASKNSVILITGSLFLAGEAREILGCPKFI